MNEDDTKAIARKALDALSAGGSLEDAMREGIKVAALRHHAAERAWLSMQLADLEKPPNLWMPEDLFIIWRQIDAEFPDRQTPKHVRLTVAKQFGDSRTLPHDLARYWSGSINKLEDSLQKVALLEQHAPEHMPINETQLGDLRAVYNGLHERVVNYLTSESTG